MKAKAVPLGEFIEALPEKDKKEIYRSIVWNSIPKNSSLIKEIHGEPSPPLKEVLKRKNITLEGRE